MGKECYILYVESHSVSGYYGKIAWGFVPKEEAIKMDHKKIRAIRDKLKRLGYTGFKIEKV